MGWLPIEALRALTAAKFVNHSLLNRLGLQVARTVAAHAIHGIRRVSLRGAATKDQLDTLDRDGIVVIPDFLPHDEFVALRDDALHYLRSAPGRIHCHGPNRLLQRTVDPADARPRLRELALHPVLRDLFDHGERLPLDFDDVLFAVEELAQGEGDELDPETELHTDIFFPTHKGWLYLDDVTLDSGPFVYVKGSHRAPSGRLRREYQFSIHGNGKSRRVGAAELAALGLTETVLVAKANTLVVANVCGYHRRLRGKADARRYGIHFSHRRNPFLPRVLGSPNKLPGLRTLRSLRGVGSAS